MKTKGQLEARIAKLEERRRPVSDSVAFVVWERTGLEAEATLQQALDAGVVKRFDPVIMGVLPGDAPLPEPRWADIAALSDAELNALAAEEQRKADAGEVRRSSPADWAAVSKKTDSELCADLISRLPRVA